MKKILFSLLAAGLLATCAQAQLIITGIYDGDASDPKGIEVFAVSGGDYTGWTVDIFANGSATGTTGYTFAGSLSTGDYIFITSTPTTLTGWNWDTTKGTVISDGSFNQNGDDAFAITDGSVNIDVFGVIGTDGTGEAWEYTDSWAYRKDNVSATTSFSTADWIFGGVNALESAVPNQQTVLTNQFGTYAVPEPSSFLLFGAGMGALALLRRKK
jgi:hypothetical protein